jgi:hypothetical protein
MTLSAKCADIQVNFHKVQEAYSLVAKKGTICTPTSHGMANHPILQGQRKAPLEADLIDEEVVPDDYEFKQVTRVKKFRPLYLK